jgi:hypothetical protein
VRSAFAALALLTFITATAEAAPKKGRRPAAKPAATPGAPAATATPAASQTPAAPATKKEKTFDFAAMGIEGRVLAPQLLYLLGRIKVELERGELQSRSFVPEMVRSVDEGGL